MNRPVRFNIVRRIKHHLREWYAGLFPTPIEARLITVLGGSTLTIGTIRRNGRQLTLTISRGRLLRSARFRRSVLDGAGVLANDVQWAIAIQGPEYERDVVAAYDRDEHLQNDGWRVFYITARNLWENPGHVRQDILRFINS